MEAPAEDTLNALDDANLSGGDDDTTGNASPQSKRDDGKKSGGWRGLSAFKAQASMQDKLLEK